MRVFVSGHLDLTEAEFAQHYLPRLLAHARAGDSFLVGDARGTDLLAQRALRALAEEGVRAEVTVFHMLQAPRHNAGPFPTRGGFASDTERDAAMTEASDADLAWVRPGREKSGTARNLARRR